MSSSGILDTPSAISDTFLLSDDGTFSTAAGLPSALPRHDLILLHSRHPSLLRRDGTLPVSFYPAPVGKTIAAHFIAEHKPELEAEGWTPCFGGMLVRKWVKGEVVGYRDFAGNEARVNLFTPREIGLTFV